MAETQQQQQLVGSEALQRILQALQADQQRQDTDIGDLADGTLYPVDVSALTPATTFRKNAIVGINGVLYRAKTATADFPVTLTVSGGEFVTNTVGGKTAYVVSDATLSSDWEVWTDVAIEYWTAQLNARATALEAAQAALAQRTTSLENLLSPVTYGGQTYQIQDLFNAMAQLMPRTVVVQS